MKLRRGETAECRKEPRGRASLSKLVHVVEDEHETVRELVFQQVAEGLGSQLQICVEDLRSRIAACEAG
jgi:hypothetical protein